MKRGNDDRWPYNCAGRASTRSNHWGDRRGDGACHAYGTYLAANGKHYCQWHIMQGANTPMTHDYQMVINTTVSYPQESELMPQLSPNAYVSDRSTQLRASLDQTLNELARLEARPKEPAESVEDATIFFTKTFSNVQNVVYHYAAVRVSKIYGSQQWYVSGPQQAGQAFSWDQLLDFIEDREPQDALPQIWFATEWMAL